MLDSLRSAAGTWLAKILLGLLVVSFAVWGISGSMFNAAGGRDVVSAGSTSVSMNEFRLAYDRQLSILSQRFGSRITREQAVAFGIDNQVLAQLVAGAVLDEQAREMGLGLSRDRIAHLTASDPAFHGPGGQFDRQQFEYVLRQVGMSAEDYLRSREQAAVRQQIVEAVSDGMKAPETLLRAMALYRGEDRTVEYVAVPRSLVEPIEDPSQEILQTWFDEHKADYAAPEYRKISLVKLEPEDIADPSTISEDQVREYYETHKDSYTTPERRTIEQIVFANKDEATTAYESIRAGTTFEDLVKAEGKTLEDVQLGTFAKEDVADPAVAEAAFSLARNEVSNVVDGQFGSVILRVTQIEEASVQPLSEVQAEIAKDLALDEANRILLDVHDGYEDARAGGATMQEAAESQKLKVRTIEAVDRSGRRPDGTIITDLPESNELLAAAFEAEEKMDYPPISTASNGFVFYEVQEITPARDRTLDEVRDQVVTDWKEEEAISRLEERATELEKQLKDGKSLQEIASEIGQETQTKRGLRREADDADIGRAGVAAVFGVPKGGTGVFAGPSGDSRFLFQVTEVFEPAGAGPDSLPEDMRNAIASGLSGDLLDELVMRLQTKYDVTVNRNVMQQALSF
ncbi:peptidyl-prolyl cis-trans isomerase D [Mesorhizobium sp. J18]|uniref:peptidyl-prolyl cis-trans isomerase n=1 Tax=Mesorhizobium sp. J18 TaxID=935263 RepID=UPI00119AC477|nr:peptidyl-prolyl cis-trans isomerase [Mesorhizobium sp. J18]TWG99110.1 peptidyl-prolyl cis-trans isomerase D [Mesorhizobium sp. J18]